MSTHLLAQLKNPVLPSFLGGSGNPGEYTTGGLVFGSLLGAFIAAFFIFSFIFALVYLLLGGISWITASGDKAKLEDARNKITHAIVGLLIVGSVWAIMLFLGTFFGISFPNIPFPSVLSPSNVGPGGVPAPTCAPGQPC